MGLDIPYINSWFYSLVFKCAFDSALSPFPFISGMEGEFGAQIFCPHFVNRKLHGTDFSRLFFLFKKGIQIVALLPVFVQNGVLKSCCLDFLWHLPSAFFVSTGDASEASSSN